VRSLALLSCCRSAFERGGDHDQKRKGRREVWKFRQGRDGQVLQEGHPKRQVSAPEAEAKQLCREPLHQAHEDGRPEAEALLLREEEVLQTPAQVVSFTLSQKCKILQFCFCRCRPASCACSPARPRGQGVHFRQPVGEVNRRFPPAPFLLYYLELLRVTTKSFIQSTRKIKKFILQAQQKDPKRPTILAVVKGAAACWKKMDQKQKDAYRTRYCAEFERIKRRRGVGAC